MDPVKGLERHESKEYRLYPYHCDGGTILPVLLITYLHFTNFVTNVCQSQVTMTRFTEGGRNDVYKEGR